jgi:hypothetical protein
VEALAERARARRTALHDEVAARDALPDERHAAEGALGRARRALEEYQGSYEKALSEFGPAALGEVPNPGELSSNLLHAEGCLDRASRAASAAASRKPATCFGRPPASRRKPCRPRAGSRWPRPRPTAKSARAKRS